MNKCSVDSCPRESKVKGFCPSHYARHWRGADVDRPIGVWKYEGAECEVAGCARPARGRGMCDGHYQRVRQGFSGSIESPFQGRQPGEWREWRVNNLGYVERHRVMDGKRERQLQHRLVMSEMIGRELLPHENVHHKNGDRADNRPENLELWSSSQPPGQRVQDKVIWAREIINLYGELDMNGTAT